MNHFSLERTLEMRWGLRLIGSSLPDPVPEDGTIQFGKRGQQRQIQRDARVSALLCIVLHI